MEFMDRSLHLPDFQFAKYCERKFYINKGIYNTIDDWFYKQGIVHILERRRKIVQFMDFISNTREKKKFGRGGLMKLLEDFWHEQETYALAVNKK